MDAATELQAEKVTTKEQAMSAMTKNDKTLDELADSLLGRVAAFFGECVGGDTFCGISVDEVRDENGLIMSLKLVACDIVNGDPVRREAR